MAGMVDYGSAGKIAASRADDADRGVHETAAPLGKWLAALQALTRRASQPASPGQLVADAMPLAAEVLQADLWTFAQVVGGDKLVVKAYPAGRAERSVLSSRPLARTLGLNPEESLAGKALDAQGPISAHDLQLPTGEHDPFLRELGVRAALVVPMLLAGEPFGAVGLYRKRARPFSAEETAFLESVVCCMMPAVARYKAEAALGDQRRFVSALLETIDSLVLVLDVDGHVEGINRACRELAGFSLPEIRDKSFCSVFAVPEEEELFRTTLRRAVNNKQGCRFESTLLSKDGQRHHIAWSLKVVVDKQAFVQAILLTGTDKTDYVNVRERLSQAEQTAREATAAVRELRRQLAEQPLNRRAATDQQPGETPADPPASGAAPESSSSPGPPSGAERRRSPRRPYRYRQMIAPIVDGRIPTLEDLFEVECHDISAGGLSFYYPERPSFKHLVVALGQAPFMTHFKAEVVRVVDQSDETRTRFLVGCRFMGRIYL